MKVDPLDLLILQAQEIRDRLQRTNADLEAARQENLATIKILQDFMERCAAIMRLDA